MIAAILAATAFATASTSWAAAPSLAPSTSFAPTTAPWQIQLQGRIDTTVRAPVVEVDGFDSRAATVARLKRAGRRVLCYLDAGSWEAYRPDRDAFPREILGRRYAGYPDERWLDIRRIDLLAPLIAARLERCRRKGFDAADGDNVDGFQNNTGFSLTAADQLRYNRWLADETHRHRMAAILKNDGAQARALAPWFEGAVVEECFELGECSRYRPFIRARKPVYAIEYARPSRRVCSEARRRRFSVIFMRPSLAGSRRTCG